MHLKFPSLSLSTHKTKDCKRQNQDFPRHRTTVPCEEYERRKRGVAGVHGQTIRTPAVCVARSQVDFERKTDAIALLKQELSSTRQSGK
ncbi:hypothetical protein VZT92_021961 [Zoarces viviparus]|uniref:Uncharacterized protein n=1 Tax=Zoarces viviparus TaxID=48416 RepID=A0AAW1EAB3_ZOAVI